MKQNNLRILAVDPSGTGITGMFFKSEAQEQFFQYWDQDWKRHQLFIFSLLEKYVPDMVLYENSNYVSLRGKDMTSLFKLLGWLESLPNSLPELKVEEVLVSQVKGLRSKLLKGEQKIEGLEYKKGKGWHHKGKKISTHELDAYLVYWLWNNKQNNELISKSMSATKTKLKPKPNLRDHE